MVEARQKNDVQFKRDIQSVVGQSTFNRGMAVYKNDQVLWSAVQRGKAEASGIAQKAVHGVVQGTDRSPYKVFVAIHRHAVSHRLMIDGECSCPVGFNCKHVVALLLENQDDLAVLEKQSQPTPLDTIESRSVTDVTTPRASNDVAAWLGLLDQQLRIAQSTPTKKKHLLQKADELIYRIYHDTTGLGVALAVEIRPRLKSGALSSRRYAPLDAQKVRELLGGSEYADYLTTHDRELLEQAEPMLRQCEISLRGKIGAELLALALATGRLYWERSVHLHQPLWPGESRPLKLEWCICDTGMLRMSLAGAFVTSFALSPLYAIDFQTGECFTLVNSDDPSCFIDDSEGIVSTLLNAPELSPDAALGVNERIETLRQNRAIQPFLRSVLPNALPYKSLLQHRPQPVLRLTVRTIAMPLSNRFYFSRQTVSRVLEEKLVPVARCLLRFGNEDMDVSHCGQQGVMSTQGVFCQIRVSQDVMDDCDEILEDYDLTDGRHLLALVDTVDVKDRESIYLPNIECENVSDYDDKSWWSDFVIDAVPELEKSGWIVEYDDAFPIRFYDLDTEWYSEIHESSGVDWFGLELGIEVEGERINVLPILEKIFRLEGNFKDALRLGVADDQICDAGEGYVALTMPDGRRLRVEQERLERIYNSIYELFDYQYGDEGYLQLSRLQLASISQLELTDVRINSQVVERFLRALRERKPEKEVSIPSTFKATLRPYQFEGVQWLQYLRELAFGGILGDDMGLGKTVQTLAHLAIEKRSGRMSKPSLLLAPTSVVSNWVREAQRFLPHLKVLVLRGPERHAFFESVNDHDLVITSYPLLPRDHEVLRTFNYYYLILDEAQIIKNPRAKMTQVVCSLEAEHRLCLSGTPMENHLGELWSLAHFLNPGILSSEGDFRKYFRTPIERNGDVERQNILTRRLSPFLLRRTKEAIVNDLPEKTEIIQTVSLHGAQRDLYESIRVSMLKKVRDLVKRKGLNRSRIEMLEAMLKLRQVCCHPALVKLPAAKKVKTSAKMEALLEMLPEMLEEGRKVLLFSQFTSMLAIIEDAVQSLGIDYVKLTGSTRKRQAVIDAFQAGEVPLFLISLKAGGTGLNLTAADTVIHYDPWWNPAVENQATDRAYRIGQDKPVFVYKFITEETIEEKILHLQERKQALADGVYEGAQKQEDAALTEADFIELFS